MVSVGHQEHSFLNSTKGTVYDMEMGKVLKALRMEKGVRINPDLCVGCGHCQNVCPFGAIVEGSEAK